MNSLPLEIIWRWADYQTALFQKVARAIKVGGGGLGGEGVTVGRMVVVVWGKGGLFGAGAGESIDTCISRMLSNLSGVWLLNSDRLMTTLLQPTCKRSASDRSPATHHLRHTYFFSFCKSKIGQCNGIKDFLSHLYTITAHTLTHTALT